MFSIAVGENDFELAVAELRKHLAADSAWWTEILNLNFTIFIFRATNYSNRFKTAGSFTYSLENSSAFCTVAWSVGGVFNITAGPYFAV